MTPSPCPWFGLKLLTVLFMNAFHVPVQAQLVQPLGRLSAKTWRSRPHHNLRGRLDAAVEVCPTPPPGLPRSHLCCCRQAVVNWVNFLCKRQAVVSHHSLHRPPVVILEFREIRCLQKNNVGHHPGQDLPPSPPEARGSATHPTWCQPLANVLKCCTLQWPGRVP